MLRHPEQVHVFSTGCGHEFSSDCWCEPTRAYLMSGPRGEVILVIEHNDDTKQHHDEALAERDASEDWVTKTLKGL
jgi:hypothetical protein